MQASARVSSARSASSCRSRPAPPRGQELHRGSSALDEPDERAGLLSAFYVESYLAFSLPAILAGYLVKTLGYGPTADIYGLVIAALSLGGVLLYRAAGARDEAETARRVDRSPVEHRCAA